MLPLVDTRKAVDVETGIVLNCRSCCDAKAIDSLKCAFLMGVRG